MRKQIFNIAAVIIILEGVYMVIKLIPILLNYFTPNPLFLIPFGVGCLSAILLIISGFSLLLKKDWSLLLFGTALLLPLILFVVLPTAKIPFLGNYMIYSINILVMIALFTQRQHIKP